MYVVMFCAFAAASLAAYAALDAVFADERQVRRAMKGLSAYEAEQAKEAEPLLRPIRERAGAATRAAVSRAAHLLAPADYFERLRTRLLHAGEPGGLSADGLLTVKFLSVPVALVVLGPLAVFLFVAGMRIPSFLSALLIPAAFFAPDLWLASLANSRAHAIRVALPDMLDMLTISVEAGLGLDAALGKLVANTTGPLSQEFGTMLREIQAGISRRDAFRNLSQRVDVPELTAFISAMVQADVFGVSVSQVLRSQAQEMRLKRRQLAEEMAQKAPVKIVFPLVLCILPATLIVIIGPAILTIGRMFGI
ncbi:MAG TPA: type II secretion system F family protein [Coriobacteriia bacterium]|jgi:tight adherence protein C